MPSVQSIENSWSVDADKERLAKFSREQAAEMDKKKLAHSWEQVKDSAENEWSAIKDTAKNAAHYLKDEGAAVLHGTTSTLDRAAVGTVRAVDNTWEGTRHAFDRREEVVSSRPGPIVTERTVSSDGWDPLSPITPTRDNTFIRTTETTRPLREIEQQIERAQLQKEKDSKPSHGWFSSWFGGSSKTDAQLREEREKERLSTGRFNSVTNTTAPISERMAIPLSASPNQIPASKAQFERTPAPGFFDWLLGRDKPITQHIVEEANHRVHAVDNTGLNTSRTTFTSSTSEPGVIVGERTVGKQSNYTSNAPLRKEAPAWSPVVLDRSAVRNDGLLVFDASQQHFDEVEHEMERVSEDISEIDYNHALRAIHPEVYDLSTSTDLRLGNRTDSLGSALRREENRIADQWRSTSDSIGHSLKESKDEFKSAYQHEKRRAENDMRHTSKDSGFFGKLFGK